MKVILVHGWACSPSLWGPMVKRLRMLMDDSSLEVCSVDLGFYGGQPVTQLGSYDLAIGHSFGLQWLLQTQLVRFDRLISVCGFSRFSAAEDFQCGWPHRIVQRMQKQLGRDCGAVVQNFLGKAWGPSEPEKDGDSNPVPDFGDSPDVERLNWGLEALLNDDGREQWSAFQGPKRAIAATKDPIVTVEHTNACFAGSDLQWLKSDCHLLPLKFPEICAALVRELIEVS